MIERMKVLYMGIIEDHSLALYCTLAVRVSTHQAFQITGTEV